MESKSKTVSVIGGGLGGLSCAISLATEGFKVSIYEKNEKVGGKLNVLKKEGYSFDLGPSILTLPKYFSLLFEKSGKNIGDYFTMVPVRPHWRNFFEDGKIVDLYKEPEKMRDEIEKLAQDKGELYKSFCNFLKYSKDQYDIIESGYFAKGLDTLWDFLKHYGIFSIGKTIDYKNTMAQSIKKHVNDPYLRDILEYFIKYVGSSAYNAPGYMNLMPNIQFEFDLYYVMGGMYNIAVGLERLACELGVKIFLNTEVKEINHKGKRVDGITLADGKKIFSDYVVSNMEVIPSYEKLLGEDKRFLKKYVKYEPACSGLVIHLGVDTFYPQLAHHNFFFSKDQERHFDKVFNKKELPDDPTIYLVAPTRTDPSQAPDGCDNIKILPHIPYINDDKPCTKQDYSALRDKILEKLERMGLKDLRKHIVVEDFWTPADIQKRYYSNKGSIYGVVSDWKKNYGFKAPKRSRTYKNLYFAGGSVNPGGGMPMVLLCGQNVSDKICKER